LRNLTTREARLSSASMTRKLGRQVLAIVRAQNPVLRNPFVFVGRESSSHLTDTQHTWQSVEHTAELELRMHDLRQSLTTAERGLGCGDHVIARLVGHMQTARLRTMVTFLRRPVTKATHEIATQLDCLLRAAEGKDAKK
jgi:hypothetical protein